MALFSPDTCAQCGCPIVVATTVLCRPCWDSLQVKVDQARVKAQSNYQNAAYQVLNQKMAALYQQTAGIQNGQHRQPAQASPRSPLGPAHSNPGYGAAMAQTGYHQPGYLGSPREPILPRREEPLPSAGIRAGEIIAWRVWMATMDAEQKYYLCSMLINYRWVPNKPATLLDRQKLEQRANFGSGIHAFKDLAWTQKEYAPNDFFVYGTVALWGEVIEHEHGYRGQFGKVNTLDFIGVPRWYDSIKGEDHRLVKLRKTYGVEGKSHKDFKIG